LNTGHLTFPAPFTPSILTLQIFRIGDFFVICVPGEFTTMSGRRLRATVRETLIEEGIQNPTVVIAGLSNDYSHYITTYEEYQVQRYEGASCLFGPNSLAAYQQEYSKLVRALVRKQPYPEGPTPPDLSKKTFDFQPGVVFDDGPFGRVYQQPRQQYDRNSTVKVVFYGADPRNDYKIQSTFLTVDIKTGNDWRTVYLDGDFCTKMFWARRGIAESLITITWDISQIDVPGTYRIRHFGTSKSILGSFHPYQGHSNSFVVV